MNDKALVAFTSARQIQIVMIGMLMALLAAVSVSASAQSAPPAPAMDGGKPMGHMHDMHDMGGGMAAIHGMRGMHGGMGPGMMFRGSPERIGRMVDVMLDGLGTSDAQRSQVKQIAIQAAADLKAQAMAGKGLHQRGMQIFTAPTVDAAAAEQLRQQILQQHDQMSRRMTQAMLAVANVLTPEQRARLGERVRDRQARMEDRMKRMDGRMEGMDHEAPRR